MTSSDFLQALNAERSKDAEVLKKYSGIRQLLTELYPDNAHFIYELLQNAEDAQATEIAFCLTSEKLRVEHNATRPFTEQDIQSITSIGDSTKRDDINKIGKFGVGFKAVFSYTDTPTIYSGNYAFKIYDLIVPELIAPLDKQTDTTVFEFPFNNPKKPKEQAFEEIANGLRDLSETTLLFLTHIKAINWHNENEPPSYTRLHTHSEHRIEIKTCLAGEETSTAHYLRFMSQIPDKPAHLQVGLAYSLHPGKDNHTFDKKTNGLVSIFFPAEKETSNFRFHVHAPFAATVARDSIKDIAENAALITAIADLAVNSLHSIKTMGLLNRAFLDVLPNSQDNLSEFYEPISEKIWAELRNQPLIPIYTGGFAAGEQLYHATDDKDDKLKKLLDSGDLAHLENRTDEILDWCLDVPEALRAKIGIKAINATQFVQKLIKPPFTLSHWLELKENAWMQQFYSYLQPYNLQLKQMPLVRLNDGSHVIASKAYFSSDGIVGDNDFPTVCPAVYQSGSEEQQEEREQAREFLNNIGVNEVTECDKIELIIEKWANKKPSDEEYITHLRQFINYFKKNESVYVFDGKCILWGDAKDGTTDWYTAKQLFIDSPLMETGAAVFFKDLQNYYLLSKKYADVSSLNVDDLIDFAKNLGAKVRAEVTSEDIKNILRRWKTAQPNDEEYIKYLPQFISYSANAYNYSVLFKDQAIFWGDTKDGETKWVKASEIFIDSPFQDTSISTWYADKDDYYLLSKKYISLDISALVDFAKKLGAKDRLPIIQIKASEQNLYHQHNKRSSIEKTRSLIDKDWCIADNESDKDGLEQWLKSPSDDKVAAIWMTMCHPNTKKEVLTACYKRLVQPHGTAETRASRLVYALKTADWVPQLDEAGNTIFVTPAQATPGLLPENFKYNDDNGWLTAIEFGKEEDARAAEKQRQIERESHTYQAKVNTAKDNGFDSPEEMAAAAALVQEAKKQGKSVAELQADLAKNSNPESPKESVKDKDRERRRKHILEDSENAPSKESVMRERSIQPKISEVTAQAKAYLRPRNRNEYHQLICQCCHKEMPFKLKSGDDYFVAVQCVKNQEKLYFQNRIALCPVCAAMYKHARETDDTEICRLIVEHNAQDVDGIVKIPVTLAGQPRSLRFVYKHFFDLKTVLAKQ